MKDYLIVQNFVNTYSLLQTLSQLTLPAVIPFDYPAFATAKQIWIENIQSTSEESVELRNKAQQLMRVLQYQEEPVAEEHYNYCNKITHNRTQSSELSEDRNKKYHKAQRLSKCRQPEMTIKIVSKQKPTLEQTSVKTVEQKNSSINLNISHHSWRRDENIDSSNYNHIMPFLKQVNESKQNSQGARSSQPAAKIIQLNKREYKKNVPKLSQLNEPSYWESIPQNINQPKRQNEQKGRCGGNCLHITYECCGNKSEWANVNNEDEKVKIKQFLIRSPNNRSYAQIDSKSKGHCRENRVCSRVQNFNKNNSKLRQEFDEEQEILQKFAINRQKKPIKVFMNDPSSNQSASEDQVETRQKNNPKQPQQLVRNRNQKQFQKIKQVERNSQVEIVRQIENMKAKQIQVGKIEQWRQLQRMKQAKKLQELQYLREAQRERQEARLKKAQMMKQMQNRRQLERRDLIRRQRQQQEARQNNLLRKLKLEFSEICCQQPDEDERRVSEEIKQLELKLNEIVSNNRSLKTQESHSPNAKVVKLNLTPSRSNLHKNMAINPKSPTARASVPTKTCRLLSKRIENASKRV